LTTTLPNGTASLAQQSYPGLMLFVGSERRPRTTPYFDPLRMVSAKRAGDADKNLDYLELVHVLVRRPTTEIVEEEARVTRCSTFTVPGIVNIAPSHLIA
jgi:hypothetical protein